MTEDNELEQIKLRKIQAMLQAAEKTKHAPNNQPLLLTDNNFASTLNANKLVVVDFWAPWCGPCRAVSPIIEQLAAEYAGKVTFGKMNVDQNPRVPASFGIMSIPTIIVFYRGQVAQRIVGTYPKTHIEAAFKPYLANP
jgi:thioredoxin 1